MVGMLDMALFFPLILFSFHTSEMGFFKAMLDSLSLSPPLQHH